MDAAWLPEPSQAVAKRHATVFAGATDYVPLGLSLRNAFSINRFEYFGDPAALFANELAKAEAQAAIGSDIIPAVVLRHDPVVLPLLFGGRAEDVGGRPMIEPFLHGLDDLRRLEPPDPERCLDRRVLDALDHFEAHAPADMVIVKPPQLDPFDAALLMYGSDIFFDMADHPEEVASFLTLLTEGFIALEKYFKRRLGEPDRMGVTYLGTCLPGVRVAADSLVNLSPEMIRQFCFPIFDRLAEAFGGVLVHYCPSPNLKYYHVHATLLECASVLGIDTSGGIEYFDCAENPVRLRGSSVLVADCAIRSAPAPQAVKDNHPNINRFVVRDLEAMRAWLDGDFMTHHRSSGGGVILRATVDSVEQGRALYQRWRSFFPS